MNFFIAVVMLLIPFCFFLSQTVERLHVSLVTICWFVPLSVHNILLLYCSHPYRGASPRGSPQLDQR
ncbi:MAG: hypothetical protein J3Q66DRAFT_344575, partial [Benniella sp.]